jgi:hypothetical protein
MRRSSASDLWYQLDGTGDGGHEVVGEAMPSNRGDSGVMIEAEGGTRSDSLMFVSN